MKANCIFFNRLLNLYWSFATNSIDNVIHASNANIIQEKKSVIQQTANVENKNVLVAVN